MADTAPPPSVGKVGLKERFHRYFQHEVSALHEQIEALSETKTSGGRNEAIDQSLIGIERLSHEVKDASSYIPAYDQRTYAEAIKGLSEKLQTIRNTFDPPKKFQFKSARKQKEGLSVSPFTVKQNVKKEAPEEAEGDKANTASNPLADAGSAVWTATSLAQPTPDDPPSEHKFQNFKVFHVQKPIDSDDKSSTNPYANSTTITISQKSNTYITLFPSSTPTSSSGTISNLFHCVVDVTPSSSTAPFATLILKSVKDSLIITGPVSGPIHITGLEKCVLVLVCRQFRMHDCKNVDVYLHCASRPIIEDCEGIRFAPLPETYVTPSSSPPLNHWNEIDDFKWLKAEPSPHFRLLVESERIKEEVWKAVVEKGESAGVEEVLGMVAAYSNQKF
ncbi:TBCC-domain-containing protein [Delitschia confertaspora ATCC 74209]|uniref:TBCC-domain-containing protein n=1 Tax=Delitschia confertaspora ATCC 74209 TaxID=1513339 RepID=A0A9P4MVM9_9PLEO|nr:TBCC-domain-containing protein [Delitschia confertaspora ATCC 74209]